MSVRHFPGLKTVLPSGVVWDDVAKAEGWTIQFSKVFDKGWRLKGYRLLDPGEHLWASADTKEELVEALPEIMQRVSKLKPLITQDTLEKAATALFSAVVAVATKRAGQKPAPNK